MMGLNVAAENCNMHVREVDVCGYLATCRDLGEITKFHFGACEIQSKLALDSWAKFWLRLETNLSTADRKVLTSRTSRCRGGACGSGTARGCHRTVSYHMTSSIHPVHDVHQKLKFCCKKEHNFDFHVFDEI